MTPSEKKARADIVSEIIHESKKYEDGFISSDQFSGFLNESLDAAERRGFERAKRMAVKLADENCIYECSDARGTIEAIENMTFEDSHDEVVRRKV